MSRTTPSRFLLLLLALCLVSSVSGQSKPGKVQLKRIGATVNVRNNDTENIDLSFDVQPVEIVRIRDNNTVITTGPDSHVILVFSNGATINLKAGSELNIKTFRQDPFEGAYDPNTAKEEPEGFSRTEIFLREGELIGNVKKLRDQSQFTVATPAGAAGIRGTTFRVVFRPSGTGQAFFSVTTLEGDVAVTTSEGTVDAPISVLDSEEVAIVVEVDDETGEVTVVTPIEEIAKTTADPQVLAEMAEAAQQSAEAVIDVILTADNDQVEEGGDEGEQVDEEGADEETSDQDGAEGDEGDGNEGEGDGNDSGTDSGNESGDTGEGGDGDGGEGNPDLANPPEAPLPVIPPDDPSDRQGEGGNG